MSQTYSFIDVVAMESIRGPFARGDALFVFSGRLDALIWANGPGAAALGFGDIDAALDAELPLSEAALNQIRLVPGFPDIEDGQAISLRSVDAKTQATTTFRMSPLAMPDGEPAILFRAEAEAGGGAAERAVSGFSDIAQRIALIDSAGHILASANQFENLPIERATLVSFVRDGASRVSKLRLKLGGRELPAGIARLGETAGKSLAFVVVVDDEAREMPSVPSPGETDIAEARPVDALNETIDRNASPVRFVWRTDTEGRFSALSAEFLALIGSAEDHFLGQTFRAVAQRLGFDEVGQIAALLERRDTWSGRTVLWPSSGGLVIPVDLAALPVYDRDRRFEGFRGFGMARVGEATLKSTDRLEISDDTQSQADPEMKAARSETNVVALPAGRRQAPERAGLSSVERVAFREIGDRLKASGMAEPTVPDVSMEDATKAVELEAKPLVKETPAAAEAPAAPTAAPAIDFDSDSDARAAIEGVARRGRAQRTDGARSVSPMEALAFDPPAAMPSVVAPEPPTPPEADRSDEDVSETDTALSAETGQDQSASIEQRSDEIDEPEAEAETEGFDYLGAEDDWFALPDDEPIGRYAVKDDDIWSEPEPAIEEPIAERLPDAGAEAEPEAELALQISEEDAPPAEEVRTEDADDAGDDSFPDAAEDGDVVFGQAEDLPADAEDLPPQAEVAASDIDFDQPVPQAPLLAEAELAQVSGEDRIEFLENLPLPILVHAGDRLDFANREFFALTGYSSLDALQSEGGIDGLLFRHEGEGSDLMLLRKADGSQIEIHAHLQSIPWGSGKSLLLSTRPVDKAPETPNVSQQLLDEAKALLDEMRAIVDTATDGVVLIAPDGTIRMLSRPAEALFGLDAAAVAGKPFVSLFAIESHRAIRDYLNGLVDNGVASILNDGREVIGREAQGRFIPLFMTIGRLPAESGFCAVVRDITSWKRAEEELTQARSQAERTSSQKTEFLARVSHEIRTPLNAIIGFSELMMDERFGPIGNDRYKDYLRDINRSGNHVLDLVNDLLDISKIEAGEQELAYIAVSLNDALSEAVAMMQPQANRERVIIRSSFASRLPDVVADLRSVRQIALNLLSNAVRYTQAGGQVIVSTVYEGSGEVIMRVRDTGVGMSSAEIDEALKPFKQINALKRGRTDGTGLGLPLTKAMVEANRARFTINSTPGEGTLVEVTFPSTRVLAD